MDAGACLRARPGGGCLLLVAAQPGARRTGADGLHDGALRLKVVAPPVEGRANDAIVAWLADQLGVPKRAVRVTRGSSARRKAIEIDLPRADVQRWLAGLAS